MRTGNMYVLRCVVSHVNVKLPSSLPVFDGNFGGGVLRVRPAFGLEPLPVSMYESNEMYLNDA